MGCSLLVQCSRWFDALPEANRPGGVVAGEIRSVFSEAKAKRRGHVMTRRKNIYAVSEDEKQRQDDRVERRRAESDKIRLDAPVDVMEDLALLASGWAVEPGNGTPTDGPHTHAEDDLGGLRVLPIQTERTRTQLSSES